MVKVKPGRVTRILAAGTCGLLLAGGLTPPASARAESEAAAAGDDREPRERLHHSSGGGGRQALIGEFARLGGEHRGGDPDKTPHRIGVSGDQE